MHDRKFEWPESDTQDRWGAEPNPYYQPEACGLEVLASVPEEDADYSFSDIVLWKDIATGDIYMGHDSGCSCPVPFENFHNLKDFTLVTSEEQLHQYIRSFTTVESEYRTRPVRSALKIQDMLFAYRQNKT